MYVGKNERMALLAWRGGKSERKRKGNNNEIAIYQKAACVLCIFIISTLFEF